MIWLIEISLILTTVILMVHARAVYNHEFIKVFWGAGILLGLFREYSLAHVIHLYGYGEFNLMLLGIPVIYLLFWSNLSYIGLTWSNNYLQRDYLRSLPFDAHLPLIFLTLVLVSFALEALFSQYGLIIWQVDSNSRLWGDTPVLAAFAYGWTVVLFIKSLKILSYQRSLKWRILSLKLALAQVPVVLMLAGLLLLSNLGIILFLS